MPDNYAIAYQKQATDLDPVTGMFHNVWEVTFKVTSGPASGTSGTLAFPESDHTADKVKAAIESKIADLSAVASLGG
jgi:hypothetical protein